MSDLVSGIIEYTPQAEEDTHRRQTRLLWIFAAISLSMAAVGYLILALIVF